MYTCASCAVEGCNTNDWSALPTNCPMRNAELLDGVVEEYKQEENHMFYVRASEIEAIGYGEWTRLREIMEFSRSMGYQKLGLAFCRGLRWEAKVVDNILRQNGFLVSSVRCKVGAVPKEELGIDKKHKLSPDQFEAACNPILQARALELDGTELNIALGLCVGHDSMLFKYSHTFATTLIAKDRVLAHNPVGAIYCSEGYFKKGLSLPTP